MIASRTDYKCEPLQLAVMSQSAHQSPDAANRRLTAQKEAVLSSTTGFLAAEVPAVP
jgi:hypothetical protein